MSDPKHSKSKSDGDDSCKNCAECSCPTEKKEVSREQFFKIGLAGLSLCWAGMAAYPIYLYLRPKAGQEDDKMKVTSVEVCKLSDLPKGSGKNFRFGSIPALVVHNDDGSMHAFQAICTHLGCTVQYRPANHDIYCACHGGEYNAETGKNVAGPPPKPLPVLAVSVVGGTVIVSQA